MAEAEIKKIEIKGGAVEDYTKLKGLKKTRKQKQKGGYDQPTGHEIPITNTNLKHATNITKVVKSGGGESSTSTSTPSPPSTLPGSNPNPQPLENIKQMPALQEANKAGTIPPTVNPPMPMPNPITSSSATPSSATQMNQEQKGGKLVLAPKKKTRSKLILAAPTHGSKKEKRGYTRKIRLQMSNMKKRFTTAKVIHKESKEKSIEDIRKLLEEAKLVKPIKEGKKVPDDILRNIYKDYLLLRNKAL
jgi:hypothetical protein